MRRLALVFTVLALAAFLFGEAQVFWVMARSPALGVGMPRPETEDPFGESVVMISNANRRQQLSRGAAIVLGGVAASLFFISARKRRPSPPTGD